MPRKKKWENYIVWNTTKGVSISQNKGNGAKKSSTLKKKAKRRRKRMEWEKTE